MNDFKKLQTGEVAKMTGVSRQMLLFYISKGLINPMKDKRKHFIYSGRDVGRVMQIKALMETGKYTIKGVRDILNREFLNGGLNDQNKRAN